MITQNFPETELDKITERLFKEIKEEEVYQSFLKEIKKEEERLFFYKTLKEEEAFSMYLDKIIYQRLEKINEYSVGSEKYVKEMTKFLNGLKDVLYAEKCRYYDNLGFEKAKPSYVKVSD